MSTVVQIDQKYDGHARQVMLTAFGTNHDFNKSCIVVDEDVNVNDFADVYWACMMRASAQNDVLLIPNVPGFYRDPEKDHWGRLGIDATKPGNTVEDVAQAFWKILDKYGIEKKSRTGYSIGIGYPPDWGEHTLNIYKGDMTLLEPNICFHMIAVMQFGDWGVEASEAIRVTDKGAELFCNMSKELHVKS